MMVVLHLHQCQTLINCLLFILIHPSSSNHAKMINQKATFSHLNISTGNPLVSLNRVSLGGGAAPRPL